MTEVFKRVLDGGGRAEDRYNLEQLGQALQYSNCVHGSASPTIMRNTLRYFSEEFDAHVAAADPELRGRGFLRFPGGRPERPAAGGGAPDLPRGGDPRIAARRLLARRRSLHPLRRLSRPRPARHRPRRPRRARGGARGDVAARAPQPGEPSTAMGGLGPRGACGLGVPPATWTREKGIATRASAKESSRGSSDTTGSTMPDPPRPHREHPVARFQAGSSRAGHGAGGGRVLRSHLDRSGASAVVCLRCTSAPTRGAL